MCCAPQAQSKLNENHPKTMGMMKNYFLELLYHCSEEQLGQDAVEWAILSGHIKLSYNLEQDLRTIMGEPDKPETGKFKEMVEAYQRMVQQNNEALIESYQPVLEEILRPMPLALETSARQAAGSNREVTFYESPGHPRLSDSNRR